MSNSHKSFFYHFLFECFLSETHFHKTGRGHNTHNMRPSAPPFDSAPMSHQLFGEGTGTSRMPSFMPHFLRKPDCKHSTPSLPLQDKTQSNNTKAPDLNPSLPRHFCSSFVIPVPSTSRMETNSQTTPVSAMQRHKHCQDFSTACTSIAVLLTPFCFGQNRREANVFLTREIFAQVKWQPSVIAPAERNSQ